MLLVGANHAHYALAAHHLALVANLLDGRSDLHSRFSLLTTNCLYDCSTLNLLDNPAAARIVRHQRHPYPVPDDDADVIASDGARQVRRHLVPAFELDPNQLARQQLEDDAFRGSFPRRGGSSIFDSAQDSPLDAG